MTKRTQTALQTQIDTLIADQTNQEITPADVRSYSTDLNDTLHEPQSTVTVKDTLLDIVDDGDATKIIRHDASAITPGNTRTINMLDADVTLVAAAIEADSTDTLTNKTFDANGTGNSLSNVDVADLANGTDGELITWDAAGAPATVAVGTAAQVLTSNGVGTAPTFEDAGSGNWVLLASASPTGADVDFDGYFSATYDHYMVIGTGLNLDRVSAGDVVLRVNVGGTVQFGATDYEYNYVSRNVSGGVTVGNSLGDSSILMATDCSELLQLSFKIELFNPLGSHNPIFFNCMYTNDISGYYERTTGFGVFNGSNSVSSGIRVSGDLDAGTVVLYGLKL